LVPRYYLERFLFVDIGNIAIYLKELRQVVNQEGGISAAPAWCVVDEKSAGLLGEIGGGVALGLAQSLRSSCNLKFNPIRSASCCFKSPVAAVTIFTL
jgi:hypothetical protein